MKILKWLANLIIVLALFVASTNVWIILATYSDIYDTDGEFSDRKVALVLGTTDRLKSGEENPYFTSRISSAATLYKSNRVQHIILSGDNRTRFYNEPRKMQEALLGHGVPTDDITLDLAGFRTLDSIVRCQKIFGQNKIAIVTQQFHGYRALFISKYYNMDAVVVTADDISLPSSLPTRLREILARSLAVIDLYVLHRQPQLMGEKEYL